MRGGHAQRRPETFSASGRNFRARKFASDLPPLPSSPEVEELSSGSGDDPGDCRPSLASALPHSFPPPRWLSSCCRDAFSGDTDRGSLDSLVMPRRPSLASSPGSRLLKSVGIAGRFLGVRLHLHVRSGEALFSRASLRHGTRREKRASYHPDSVIALAVNG